ncbi:MAG: signal peptidase I [Actinomycetota bacterium]
MRTLGRMARLLVAVVTVVSVVVLLLVGVGPRTGQYRTLTVLTGSMRPAIDPGSVVVVVPVEPAELRVGDVITFHAPVAGAPVVTHRIIEITDPGAHPVVRTQGDASNAPDPWSARISDTTAWKVRYTVPAVGYAVNWLRQPVVHKVTVVGAPLLFVIVVLFDIWRKPRADSGAKPVVAGAGT